MSLDYQDAEQPPAKFDCETAASERTKTSKHPHRTMQCEALNLVVSFIKNRFNERDYNI